MGEGEWLHLLGDLLQGPHCGLARFSCLSSKARPLGGKKRAEKMVRRLPLLFSHVPSVSVRCLGVTEHVNTELLLTSLFTCLPPGYRRYDFHQMFAVLELEFNLFLNSRVVNSHYLDYYIGDRKQTQVCVSAQVDMQQCFCGS